MLNERKLTENELEQRQIALKGLFKNKRSLVKKYGADAEKVAYGIATKQAKKKIEMKNLENLKDMIQDALKNPESADLNKDGKLSDYEEKRGAAIEKNINESKGAKNYFDDLKYYYTKTLPYLDKDEKEEYKQLAKNFFSKLQEGLDEDYKPSLRAYNVIDGDGNIVYKELPRDTAIEKAGEREDYKFSATDRLAEADSNYPDFDLDKNIKYQDTSISSGMWRYTGKEQGGKGVYRNLNNGQILGFSKDDFDIFRKHLSSHFDISESLDEAKKKKAKKKDNRPIGKPMRDTSGGKAYKVYVKDPKTKKVKTVRFGSGGLRAKINDSKARAAFAARHKCSQKKDRTKAGYWSCRLPRYAKLLGLKSSFSGFW